MKNPILVPVLVAALVATPNQIYAKDVQNGSAGAAVGGAVVVCIKLKPCRTAVGKTAKKVWQKVLPATQPRSTEDDKAEPVAASRKAAKTKTHKCLGLPQSISPYKQGKIKGDGGGKWEYWLYKYSHKTFMIMDHPNGHSKGDVSPHLHGKVLKKGEDDDPSSKSNWKDGGKVCHFRYRK